MPPDIESVKQFVSARSAEETSKKVAAAALLAASAPLAAGSDLHTICTAAAAGAIVAVAGILTPEKGGQ
jgi:hypothetical protein